MLGYILANICDYTLVVCKNIFETFNHFINETIEEKFLRFKIDHGLDHNNAGDDISLFVSQELFILHVKSFIVACL